MNDDKFFHFDNVVNNVCLFVCFVVASVLTLMKTKKADEFELVNTDFDDLFLKKTEKAKNDKFDF